MQEGEGTTGGRAEGDGLREPGPAGRHAAGDAAEDGAGPLGDIARPLERAGRYLSTVAVLFILAYAAAVSFILAGGYSDGASSQVDFAAFWAAAKLALAGDAIAAFDQDILREVQSLPADSLEGELFWLYPPGVQFALAPFGLLPFWAAWLLFGGLSLAVFMRVQWRLAVPVPMGRNLLLGAPSVVITLQLGQLLMLWAAALVAALRAMAESRAAGRAAFAGLMIGLLSLKPQLGILLPVVLVAARRWDVLLWAAAVTLAVHALPTLVVGLEYWAAFFRRVTSVSLALEQDLMQHRLMVSPYAFGRFLGLPHQAALVVQAAVSLLLAVAVYRLWRRRHGVAGHHLASGVLCAAVPIATPYAYYYELVFAVPAVLLLVRGGYGAGLADRALLAAAVFGPAVLWIWTPAAPLFAPLLLAFALHAAASVRRDRPSREFLSEVGW